MKATKRSHRHRFVLRAVLVALVCISIKTSRAEDVGIGPPDEAKIQAALKDFAYPLMSSVWRPDESGMVPIYVCWENPSSNFRSQMEEVKAAVTSSWQAHSRIEFKGWQTCAPSNRGIRIQIADVGPHTQNLGRFIDGVQNGMVLNFTFSAWSPECADQAIYVSCIKSIAVHEFGHALGFAHEQNRPGTAGECAKRRQGPNGDDVSLTPWDLQSVMNYCNPTYNNDGNLSKYDVLALQRIYGKI